MNQRYGSLLYWIKNIFTLLTAYAVLKVRPIEVRSFILNPIHLIATCILAFLYVWVLYNIPILTVGLKRLRHAEQKKEETSRTNKKKLPTFSIVIPMKNEERVAERSLNASLKLDYPLQRREIIVVEDGSKDRTAEICGEYADRHPNQIRILYKSSSNGKPSALNYAIKHAKGEIIAIFDADNVPEKDALLKAASYFEDPSVAAVQGTTCAINADENLLTKFLSYEEAAWLRTYIQGKDVLNLFVPLTGSCQFLRRSVLEKVGGWDEKSLSEDVEMAAKLTNNGYRTRYAANINSWQEAPANMSQLTKQRIRWFRGYMEVAFKYGKLLTKINKKTIDAEITLIGPYLFTLYLVGYFTTAYSFVAPSQFHSVLTGFSLFTSLLTVVTLLIAGAALIYATKPRRLKNLYWLPFIYAYWSLQTILAVGALIQIIFRRPRNWTKTTKTGITTVTF
jgi:cellulose synthase/poly-beta-1,6-N-acetylglucosamine synthase-like glycosyltransferase